MDNNKKDEKMSKQTKSLYILAMVNAGIWAIALIALVILLQGHGNLKGMYVVLAGGTAIAIQLISLIAKIR
ncbi:MAG: hypothetical protein B6I19_11025 [Bacteroidetes bacterium 4572_114]|nr:MAG: hypothetical protein B6I19_11025 [Bacteroidetes bacterium 4572_114]